MDTFNRSQQQWFERQVREIEAKYDETVRAEFRRIWSLPTLDDVLKAEPSFGFFRRQMAELCGHEIRALHDRTSEFSSREIVRMGQKAMGRIG